ncbi:MAG: ATP synthase F1 subunit delta [Bacteroidales bacterium]
MNQSKISVRYSRALFESALEQKVIEKVYQDMIFIAEVCRLPEVREVLTSPVIVPSRKGKILHKIFGSDLQKLTLSLIDLTVKNGRESSIPAIARVFIHETMKYNGIRETVLTTAVKAGPSVKKQVTDIVTDLFKTKIDLKEKVDASIIGGFILKIGDNYYDASLRNKLRKIKKEFSIGAIGTQ